MPVYNAAGRRRKLTQWREKVLPFRKKLLYYGLLVVLTLLALEGMARAAYFLSFADWYGGGLPAADAAALPALGNETWRIRHPFYGHNTPRQVSELNVMPPREKPDDAVVIGLFGGSVAEEVTPRFREAVYHYFLDNHWPRRPVVIGMGHQGVQQPQQAMMAANALLLGGHFDIIVTLDGYNEMFRPVEEYQRGNQPFFPNPWDKLAELTDTDSLLVGRIGFLRAEQAELSSLAAGHWLQPSAVFGLFLRYAWESRERQIVQLNHDLAAARSAYSLEQHGPRMVFQDESDLSREAARVWYRGSLLLAEATGLTGAEYYHFLQPSQYIPGSKPLSDRELRRHYQPEVWGKSYRRAYPRLAQLGAKLQEQPINFFDLTGIFRDRYETLYVDKCCHLNDLGNELLAAAMVARMAPGLRRAATAAAPVSGLASARPESGQLLLDAEFLVYRQGRHRLVYVKDGCTSWDREARFFLHIVPANPADLPADRRENGFDNRDFQFEQAGGGIVNGRCVVDRRLPTYPIAVIRTGQYAHGRDKLWEGEYHFPGSG